VYPNFWVKIKKRKTIFGCSTNRIFLTSVSIEKTFQGHWGPLEGRNMQRSHGEIS